MPDPLDDFWPLVGQRARDETSGATVRLERYQVVSTTAAGAVRVRDAFGAEKPVDWPRLKAAPIPPVGAYVLCAVQGRSMYVLGELEGV